MKKETLTQVFSCEFYKISKSTFYYRTPLVAASVYKKEALVEVFSCEFWEILKNTFLQNTSGRLFLAFENT